MGSWYALSDVVFLGGSLLPIGGHNPFEVVQSDAAVLTGSHVTNFAETFLEMEQAGAAETVSDAATLADSVDRFLKDETHKEKSLLAARKFVSSKSDELTDIASQLIRALDLGDMS